MRCIMKARPLFSQKHYISIKGCLLFCVTRSTILVSDFFLPIFADHPGRPEIVEREVSGCNVTLKWTSPLSNNCPILFYTVRYRQKGTTRGGNNWTVINVTDATANEKELMLNCTTTYEFQARAWNELGGGDLSSLQSATTEAVTSQMKITESPTAGTLYSQLKLFMLEM